MKKILIPGIAAMIAVTSSTLAGTASYKQSVGPIGDTCVFRDTEFQVDAFGQGAFYDQGSPGWGGGLGLNYFFARYIGIGVEQSVFGRDSGGSFTEWATLGNLFLRYPICSLNMAPYAMVGGGALYGDKGKGKGVGHVGGGLEIRFTDTIGLFGDARWLYSDVEPKSGVLARTGLRFAF